MADITTESNQDWLEEVFDLQYYLQKHWSSANAKTFARLVPQTKASFKGLQRGEEDRVRNDGVVGSVSTDCSWADSGREEIERVIGHVENSLGVEINHS